MTKKEPDNPHKSTSSSHESDGKQTLREQKDARLKQALRRNLRRRKVKSDDANDE